MTARDRPLPASDRPVGRSSLRGDPRGVLMAVSVALWRNVEYRMPDAQARCSTRLAAAGCDGAGIRPALGRESATHYDHPSAHLVTRQRGMLSPRQFEAQAALVVA
jgi:hypothetical protein